ncbi:sulfurtransferase-like selenium metabolism protein YedF [candidate division KSB1 bacterium]|nr:MAG: sulfurtransferase-like selenium metabolism protein YedF [candidate division KSB1 bacterium]
MNKEIDVRGLECPGPVLKTREALEKIGSNALVVITDNETARDNVERFAKKQGFNVKIEKVKDNFKLLISKSVNDLPSGMGEIEPEKKNKRVAIYINSNRIGNGEDELGKILMKAFLKTIIEVKPKPEKILFINSGVFLTTLETDFFDVLTELRNNGIEIYSCGTCLDYYNVKDKLKVGQVTNMYEIVNTLHTVDKVVSP